jgi:hypothetical protein
MNLSYHESRARSGLPSNWETILSTYGLDQLVHDPTRVTSKSVTLIVHIYTSRPEEVVQVRVSSYLAMVSNSLY